MFNPKSDKAVSDLCAMEYEQAVKQYGNAYVHVNIADPVLLEEIQEAAKEIEDIKTAFILWLKALATDEKDPNGQINKIQELAKNGMKELAQVWAVCEKIKVSNL